MKPSAMDEHGGENRQWCGYRGGQPIVGETEKLLWNNAQHIDKIGRSLGHVEILIDEYPNIDSDDGQVDERNSP